MVVSWQQRWGIWAALTVALAIVVLPFLWILTISFKYQIDILMAHFPFTPVLVNYRSVLFGKSSDFLLGVGNSLIVASVSTAIVLVIGTLAAYSLAWRRWSGLIMGAFLGWTIIFKTIPTIMLVGPWYLMYRELGLYGTRTGLILIYVVMHLPLTIWLMMSAFQSIPRELEDAAVVDGCRRSEAFVRVLLPLLTPGLIAAGLLSFLFSWSDFGVALNLTAKGTYTIPVVIATYAADNEVLHGEMAAGSILSAIPAIILIFLGQRFIVRGLIGGALKA